MAAAPDALEDRFVGCLLGLALGDALGAPYEGSPGPRPVPPAVLGGRARTLRTTDDTEMAVLLAGSLAEHGGVEADALARAWAQGFDERRGYGPGALLALARMRAGEDWRTASRSVHPEGSFGNGAAMRAAPIGLWFHGDPAGLEDGATRAASVTHAHPLGIEGGVLVARATAMALSGRLDLAALADGCRHEVFRRKVAAAQDLTLSPTDVVGRLGHSVQAHDSVATALHAAGRFEAFVPMLTFVVTLGGDVDTIGAMAGSLFGARFGAAALPVDLLERLEGRAEIEAAARRLHEAWACRATKVRNDGV